MQHAYNAVTGAGMRVPLISGGGSGNYFTFAGGARVPGTTGPHSRRTHARTRQRRPARKVACSA